MSGPKHEKDFQEYLDKIDKLIYDEKSALIKQIKDPKNKDQIDVLTNSLNEVVNNIDITIKDQAAKLINDIAEPISIDDGKQKVNYNDLISSFNKFSSDYAEFGYDYIQDNYDFIEWFQKNKALISQKIDAPIEPVKPQEPQQGDIDYDKKYEEYQKSLDEYWTKHQAYEKESIPSNFVNYVKERISYISKYGIVENEYIKQSFRDLEKLYDKQIKERISNLPPNPSDEELEKVLDEKEIQLYKSYKLQSLHEKSIENFAINGPETFNETLNNDFDNTEKVDSEQLEYDVKIQNLQSMDQNDEYVIDEINKITIEKAKKICQEMTDKQDYILNNKMKKGSIMIDSISGEDMSFFLRDYEKIMSDSNSNEITPTQKNLNFIEFFNQKKDIIAYHDLKIREGYGFSADFVSDHQKPESFTAIVEHNSVNSVTKEFIEYARLKMAYISEYGAGENEYSTLSNDELNYLIKDGDEHAQLLSDLRKAESKAKEEHKVYEKNKELNASALQTAKSMKAEEDKKAEAIKPEDTVANIIENRKNELKEIQKKLLDTDPWYVINSGKFRTLKAELNATIQMMSEYRDNPSPKSIQDISNKLNSLSDLATEYNQIKVNDAKKSGKSRDINRRDISKELSNFAFKSKNDINKKASYIYEEGLKNSLKSLKSENLECQNSKNHVDLIKNMDKLGKLYNNVEGFEFAAKYKTEIGEILQNNMQYFSSYDNNVKRKEGIRSLIRYNIATSPQYNANNIPSNERIESYARQVESDPSMYNSLIHKINANIKSRANELKTTVQKFNKENKGRINNYDFNDTRKSSPIYDERLWFTKDEIEKFPKNMTKAEKKDLIDERYNGVLKHIDSFKNVASSLKKTQQSLSSFTESSFDNILGDKASEFKQMINGITRKEQFNILSKKQQLKKEDNPNLDMNNNML